MFLISLPLTKAIGKTGDNATLKLAADFANKKLPERVDEYTIAEKLIVKNNELIYPYTVSVTIDDNTKSNLKKIISYEAREHFCSKQWFLNEREEMVNITYVYKGLNNTIAKFTFNRLNCK